MRKTKVYNFEIREYFNDVKTKEDFHNIRHHPKEPFNPSKIKSILKGRRTIGESYSPLFSQEEGKPYWAIRGEVYSKNVSEVVSGILNYASTNKVGYIRLSQLEEKHFSVEKPKIESIVKEWEWKEGVLKFRNYLNNKEIIIPSQSKEYKLFEDSIQHKKIFFDKKTKN